MPETNKAFPSERVGAYERLLLDAIQRIDGAAAFAVIRLGPIRDRKELPGGQGIVGSSAISGVRGM